MKIVVLNRVYSTGILDVHDVARHICEQGQYVDSVFHDGDPVLHDGDPEMVDTIAKVTMSGGKVIRFYSFASKYCSWHKPERYPIWDSRVNRYLRSLRPTPFAKHMTRHGDLWNVYSEFVDIIVNFQNFYGLGSFGFKEIDKFLWTYGGDTPADLSVGART